MLALAVLFLAGCSSMRVTVDSDPSRDFSGLRTFAWLPGIIPAIDDPRVDRERLDTLVRRAVEGALQAKGYVPDVRGTPDFWLAYHVNLIDRVQVSQLNAAYGYGAGWGWRYGPRHRPPGWDGMPETYTFAYDEGTLILDIVEPGSRRLLWRAAATDEVNLSASSQTRSEKIDEAARRMLHQFPAAMAR